MSKPSFIISLSATLGAVIASHYNPQYIAGYAFAAVWVCILARLHSRYEERREEDRQKRLNDLMK